MTAQPDTSENPEAFYPRAPALFRVAASAGETRQAFQTDTLQLHPSLVLGLLRETPGWDPNAWDPDTGRGLLHAVLLGHRPAFAHHVLPGGRPLPLRPTGAWPFAETAGAERRRAGQEMGLYLVESGADAWVRARDGTDACDAAFALGWPALLQRLAADPRWTPADLVRRRIRVEDADGRGMHRELPWLHAAALFGDEAILGVLLESGFPADLPDDHGQSALFWARHLPIAQRLRNAGAPLLAADGRAVTAHWTGLPPSVLLAADLNILVNSVGGETPSESTHVLMEAIRRGQKGTFDAVWKRWGRRSDLVLDAPEGPMGLCEYLARHCLRHGTAAGFPSSLANHLIASKAIRSPEEDGVADAVWLLVAALAHGDHFVKEQMSKRFFDSEPPDVLDRERLCLQWERVAAGMRSGEVAVGPLNAPALLSWCETQFFAKNPGWVQMLSPTETGHELLPFRWFGALAGCARHLGKGFASLSKGVLDMHQRLHERWALLGPEHRERAAVLWMQAWEDWLATQQTPKVDSAATWLPIASAGVDCLDATADWAPQSAARGCLAVALETVCSQISGAEVDQLAPQIRAWVSRVRLSAIGDPALQESRKTRLRL